MNRQEFFQTVSRWLTPMGYVETYANKDGSEVHFTKEGIRVISVHAGRYSYCYLYKDIIMVHGNYGLKSGKLPLGEPFDAKLQDFKNLISALVKP